MARMSDQEVARAAAERWGETDPTFDDVITEHTPQYGTEPAHTQRWHRIARMAYDMIVTPNRCENCGTALQGRRQRRYCDQRCNAEAYRERVEAR